MAGTLYLGRNKVCPAILVGGSEPTEYFTLKFPDNLVEAPEQRYFALMLQIVNTSGDALEPICIDFNNVKVFNGSVAQTDGNFTDVPLIAKVEKIEKLSNMGLQVFGTNCLAVEGHKDINFESLIEVGRSCLAQAFYNDNKTFDNIFFPKLTKIDKWALDFLGNNGVDIYFYAVTESSFLDAAAIEDIGRRRNKTLHFPSNLSSFVPTLSGYPNFGGTGTTILYDLEPTEN